MQKILMCGCPGAGKGTQSKLLEKVGLYQISTGDVIRASADPRIVHYKNVGYAKGELLSDELIFEMIEWEVSNLPKDSAGYILDGAVRTLPQAKYTKDNFLIEKVVSLELSEDVAIKRILDGNRGRSDDNPEAIKKRFRDFNEKSLTLLSYLGQNFEFHAINAEPAKEEVYKAILGVLGLG